MHLAGRDYWLGTLDGMPVVAVLSGIGKVAAAMTTAVLLQRFDIGAVLFTGTAGTLDRSLAVGDVVVADSLLQHDMDASPLFPRYQVPLIGLSRFIPDPVLTPAFSSAAGDFLRALAMPQRGDSDLVAPATLSAFGIRAPKVHRGLIVSGDRFVASAEAREQLRAALPAALAVEMEGAAVAQVCHAFEAPYAVMRVISDAADDDAGMDFTAFVEEAACLFTLGTVRRCVARLRLAAPWTAACGRGSAQVR